MPYRLSLLAGIRVLDEDGRDITPSSKKSRALLAFVALSNGCSTTRKRAAEHLWSPPKEPLANLRQLISALHRFWGSSVEILTVSNATLALNTRIVSVDHYVLEEMAALEDPMQMDSTLLKGLSFGIPLSDCDVDEPAFEEWQVWQRAELERNALVNLGRILRTARKNDAYELLETAAACLLKVDPASEEAYRALMEAAHAQGARSKVKSHYEGCRSAIYRLVGTGISQETQDLMDQIEEDWAKKTVAQPKRPLHSAVLEKESAKRPAPISTRAAEATLLRVNSELLTDNDPIARKILELAQETITENLSGMRWLFEVVDAHDSSGTADYQLDLAVFSSLNGVRCTLKLVRLPSRRLIWADHLDLSGIHLFDELDAASKNLSALLEREILIDSTNRSWACPPEQLDWRGRMMLAIPLIFRLTNASLREAERLLDSSASERRDNATPIAFKAFTGFLKVGQSKFAAAPELRQELDDVIRRGFEIDPDNVLLNAVAGHVHSFVNHDFESANLYFERARQINPSSAYPWALSAITQSYLGNGQEALSRLGMFRKLWRVDPYPHFFGTAEAIAAAIAGDYSHSVRVAKQVLAINSNFNATYRPLISSLGHLGRIDEAQIYVEQLLRKEPEFNIEWFRVNYPPIRGHASENYIDGFLKAGVAKN